MPVTARLSSRFYEKLGDEATNDLVNWLNDVDAELRNHLRESNDRNWDRFRADLRAGLAELRADLRTEFQAGLADLRTELQVGRAELRTEFQTGLADLRTEFQGGLAELRTEVHGGLAEVRVELHKGLTSQLRWMFAFWATTLLAIAGLKLL